jgi:cytoskeletal protein CcmA (bactofilin family)
MFGRFQRPEADAIEVIIGPNASFEGYLRSDTSVRIDGAIEGGRIETTANVILTELARVQCDITAKTVSIRGVYHGTIQADRVELLEGCQVHGVLNVNSFYMDDGVALRAEVNIQGEKVQKRPVAPRPAPNASIPVVSGEQDDP